MMFTKVVTYGQWCLLGLMFVFLVANRFQLLPFKASFGGFALATVLVAVSAVIGIVIFALSFGPVSGTARPLALSLVIVGSIPLVLILVNVGKGFNLPRIHDISTNLENNIEFSHAQSQRKPEENSLALPADEVKAQQRAAYPAISSLLVELPAEDAYAKAIEVARQLGWEVLYENAAEGKFEAIDKTALFVFIDDIVVRVLAEGDGSRIDLRSVSRVGVSDLGANAKRIEQFKKTYQAR